MFPKEERDALVETLQDTILQDVPGAMRETIAEGAFAYRRPDTDASAAFCVLVVERDHLELRFPACRPVGRSDDRFEPVAGTETCRLVTRKRTDLPGEVLSAAIKEAAGVA